MEAVSANLQVIAEEERLPGFDEVVRLNVGSALVVSGTMP